MFHTQQPLQKPLVNYHFNNKFPQFPPAPSAVSQTASSSSTMRIRGEPQVFVSVAYDFEYLAEDGKRVFMKENEILLLINKTNHDWWQVIRRGDRRPFYAPAKYVVELRPEDVPASEMMASPGGHHPNLNFSTFGPLKGKRSSYAPASGSSGVMLIPPPASSLETSGRLNDRYRSNSLDSILVADLDKQGQSIEHLQEMVAVHHHSQRPHASSATYHVFTQQHHFIPKHQVHQLRSIKAQDNNSTTSSTSSSNGLQKRPTFEGLDKRKSWTVVADQLQQQSSANSALAFNNSENGEAQQRSTGGRPGSRISAYQNTHILNKEPSQLFTISNVNHNASYDPRRKKPVPLPRSKIPVLLPGLEQGQRKNSSGGRFVGLGPRSKTDLTASGLANYKRRPSVNVTKYPTPVTVPTLSNNSSKPVPQKRGSNEGTTDQGKPITKKKPPKTEAKPTFSTFKQINRTASLSDLINEDDDHVITASSARSRKIQQVETASLASVDVNVPDPVLPPTKSITVQTDEVDLNLVGNKVKSDPLRISTEPLNGFATQQSNSGDISLSTSFDSMDDSKSKSTDVSMEDAVVNVSDSKGKDDIDDYEEDLPTPPATPPIEERLKSPVSTTSRSPPSPTQTMTPTRKVTPEWEEYEDSCSGRKFYVNANTKEKSWKPPRKPRPSESGSITATSPKPDLNESQSSHEAPDDPKSPAEAPLEVSQSVGGSVEEIPNGYEKRTDADSGNSYYVNVFTGVRWFSAQDSNGKKYYYEENGNESCWALPNVSQSIQDNGSPTSSTPEPEINVASVESAVASAVATAAAAGPIKAKTKTEILEQRRLLHLPISTPDFKIGNVNIIVIKQGPLHKTKLLENGKKQRKNWNVSHVVLTDTFLLFFKDAKSFATLQSGQQNCKPDNCIDLKGANVDWCSADKSKRSNVFEVNSVILGTTFLLQDDSLSVAAEWLQEIQRVIDALNSPTKLELSRKPSVESGSSTLQLPSHAKKLNKVGRTKSLKMKILGSNEDILDDSPGASPVAASGASGASGVTTFTSNSKNNNIREKLRKFFLRRPAMDDLFRRGIIKNEPVFGSTLRELQLQDLSDVPNFVKKCIECIEKGDLMKTDGVYRQSGNLSTIQKIRYQVDQGNLGVLDSVEDVHVLTGSLKLFFRELKEPLIPWEIVGKLLLAANHQSKKQKIKQMKDCVAAMATPHRTTLSALLKHLVKVTQFKEKNRMQIPNLAIVFGPTLMWPPAHLVSVNLALDMMQQNIIVEALLNNVHNIFP